MIKFIFYSTIFAHKEFCINFFVIIEVENYKGVAMLKKILMSGLLSSMLLLSGCGDDEGESRLETQQMLDDGDFTGVISKLESSARTDADYLSLGSAYMGKAGLTLTNIVRAIADGADDEESSNGFSSFVTAISENSSSTALLDLDQSALYFKKVVGNRCLNRLDKSSDTANICLYLGLVNTGSAAVVIDLIAGDIDVFSNDAVEDEKLVASTCAMSYAFNKEQPDECTIVEQTDVYFTDLNRSYTPLLITVNNDSDYPLSEYHYLMNDLNRTVITKGYCTTADFTTRRDTYELNVSSPYYACPINETENATELTTAGILVDVLNDGIDSIANSAGEDIQTDIDEFKCDILGGDFNGYSCNVDGNITESSVVDYLNNQN
jgi:hypothetical protein